MTLWALLGCYQLLPANRAPGAVSGIFAAAASGEPGPVRSLDSGLASLTAGHGQVASLVIWALCVAVGLGVASVRLTRPVLIGGGLLGALLWVGQAFGGIATGQATDPNSGPLFILLAVCLWSAIRPGSPRLRRPVGEKIGSVGIGEGMPVEQEGGARHGIAGHRSAPGAADSADRTSARAQRRDDRPVRQPSAHSHRTRWHRQDPAGACCRGRGSGFLLPGRLLGRTGSGR